MEPAGGKDGVKQMNLGELQRHLAQTGQPAFRLAQAKRAFYAEFLGGWDDLSTFPKQLRDDLKEAIPWDSLELVTQAVSSRQDTVKVLFSCADGLCIEAVLMRHEAGRNTVCVSSQAGCAMGCKFCATGQGGLKRNLTADEIVEQVIYFARYLKTQDAHVTNIVFMGMGEPFSNYDEVLSAIKLLHDPEGFNLGARHMTVSTCGLVPGIKKLAAEKLQVNLAISLHAANDALRDSLMPVNKLFPLRELMAAVDDYAAATNRKVLFEYLLIDGVNDSDEAAEDLVKLLGHNRRLFQVNLIKYHQTGKFMPSPQDQRERFMQILRDNGILVTFRVSFGEDIDAACGQLAARAKKNS